MTKKQESGPSNVHPECGKKFEKLVAIMAVLRSPDGCPWDREQTHESLRQYLLEEAYEVLEALDTNDATHLKEEMGDLLLQILFHAQIASEENRFDINDIIESISDKLIRRHPNVFGDVKIDTAQQQAQNWERLKKAEGKKSAVDGVPSALSALLRSLRIQQKAAAVGFDWGDIEPVWEKVEEELTELREALENGQEIDIEEEFGDLLFSLVNLSRFININPEDALRRTTNKFIRRFQRIENHFADNSQEMHDAPLSELDAIWEKIKGEESSSKGEL